MANGAAYRTLAGRGETGFEIRGSTFLGYASPATRVAEAEAFIDEIRAKHDDATHNVPAYRVREPSGSGHLLREYQSDDGEPTGSSGKPALNVLVQEDLENVVVVVSRYFGGTELGVGGLARAYSKAVKGAIEDAGNVEKRPQERFVVQVTYDDSGTVRGILESSDATFDADYAESVTFEVTVAAADGTELRDRIRSATRDRADIDREQV
ncbi:MAG: YigZ family protein [Halodesulfurarchaeum sp.]